MNKLKKHWKDILIILLAIMFVVNCNGKGNFKRKYEKQIRKTEYVADSLNAVYKDTAHYIDSLKTVIRFKNTEISSLEKEISIYVDQNRKLANKPVIVKVENTKNEETE